MLRMGYNRLLGLQMPGNGLKFPKNISGPSSSTPKWGTTSGPYWGLHFQIPARLQSLLGSAR